MRLRFLGAGGAFTRRFGTTCSVLELSQNRLWLIDCGRQAPDQLTKAGLAWHDIEGQLITHVHGDHVYGMEEFAFSRYFFSKDNVRSVFAGGPKPGLIAHQAVRNELWQVLAPSLRYQPGNPLHEGRLEDYFHVLTPVDVVAPRESPWNHMERFAWEDLLVVCRETLHVPGKPCTSLELTIPQSDLVAWWSGDSLLEEQLLSEQNPRTTVFFHDCSFHDTPGQVHGRFSKLCELPESIRKKVVLMHHEDDVESRRSQVESYGFRLAMPGDIYDLRTGLLCS